MISNNEAELNNIKKKIVKTQIIGAPGAILLGLGLYGMFGANGNAFHPLLNDKSIVNSLLIVGVAIELWQLYVLIPLFKKQSKLSRLI
jgi:hypothetical protein